MKYRKILVFLLSALLLGVLEACVSSPQESQPTGRNDHVQESTAAVSESSASALEHPSELCETWIYTAADSQGIRVYRLTLLEDGIAQIPVQNEIGVMLALYHGTWSAEADQLILELERTPEMDDPAFTGAEQVGGRYTFRLESGMLELRDSGNEFPIIPELGGSILKLESSAAQFLREKMEWEVCETVRSYYETVTGMAYPGYVLVDSRSEDGMLTIRLMEEMEDHSATIGWFTVDPETYLGTDDMMGTEIDFNPYRRESVG